MIKYKRNHLSVHPPLQFNQDNTGNQSIAIIYQGFQVRSRKQLYIKSVRRDLLDYSGRNTTIIHQVFQARIRKRLHIKSVGRDPLVYSGGNTTRDSRTYGRWRRRSNGRGMLQGRRHWWLWDSCRCRWLGGGFRRITLDRRLRQPQRSGVIGGVGRRYVRWVKLLIRVGVIRIIWTWGQGDTVLRYQF